MGKSSSEKSLMATKLNIRSKRDRKASDRTFKVPSWPIKTRKILQTIATSFPSILTKVQDSSKIIICNIYHLSKALAREQGAVKVVGRKLINLSKTKPPINYTKTEVKSNLKKEIRTIMGLLMNRSVEWCFKWLGDKTVPCTMSKLVLRLEQKKLLRGETHRCSRIQPKTSTTLQRLLSMLMSKLMGS